MNRCRKSGNRPPHTTGASRSRDRMASARVSKLPRSASWSRQGLASSLVARVRVRPANTAAPRLPPETELIANTCWAKFGTEVLHARQELGGLVGRIEPAALGRHDVDGIGLGGVAIGRGVLARGEPGLERGLHGRALDVGLLVAELVVVGEAEHLEADQQDDQRAQDRHAEDAVVAREQSRQHGEVDHPQREQRDRSERLRQVHGIADQQDDRGQDDQRKQHPVAEDGELARPAAAVRGQTALEHGDDDEDDSRQGDADAGCQ